MNFWLPTKHVNEPPHSRWPGAAFLIEAMVLVVFVAASMVVFTQLFAESAQRSVESDDLARAVALASDMAERFTAAPDQAAGQYEDQDLRAVCDVQCEQIEGGVLYRAVIRVFVQDTGKASDDFREGSAGEPVYELSTAAYESGAIAHG